MNSLILANMGIYKYKLLKKVNPQKRNEAPKWYAVSISDPALETKEMARAATENTSTAPIELEAAIELFLKYAKEQLQQGRVVRLGDLGTLRVSISSEGADSPLNFNPQTMIKKARVVFTPNRDFQAEVVGGLQFQNGGILDDGISYASIADYKRAKGLDEPEATE